MTEPGLGDLLATERHLTVLMALRQSAFDKWRQQIELHGRASGRARDAQAAFDALKWAISVLVGTDALQIDSAARVDGKEQAGDGEAVGGGDAGPEAAGAGGSKPTEAEAPIGEGRRASTEG